MRGTVSTEERVSSQQQQNLIDMEVMTCHLLRFFIRPYLDPPKVCKTMAQSHKQQPKRPLFYILLGSR